MSFPALDIRDGDVPEAPVKRPDKIRRRPRTKFSSNTCCSKDKEPSSTIPDEDLAQSYGRDMKSNLQDTLVLPDLADEHNREDPDYPLPQANDGKEMSNDNTGDIFREYRTSIHQILAEHAEQSVDAIVQQIVRVHILEKTGSSNAAVCTVQETGRPAPCEPTLTRSGPPDDTTARHGFVGSKSLTSSAMDAIYVQRAVSRFLKRKNKESIDSIRLGKTESVDKNSRTANRVQICRFDEPISAPGESLGLRDIGSVRGTDLIGPGGHARKSIFLSDSEDAKCLLRNAMFEPEYNVHELYWDTGICQDIVKRPVFEYTTLLVIATNALWFAFDIDWNHAKLLVNADPVFIIADNLFCVYYTAEIWLRFFSFRSKRDILTESWFLFDATLWVSIVFDVWVLMAFPMFGLHEGLLNNTILLRCFRIGRLARLCRMIEVFRAVPELMVLIKGMGTAIRAVSAFVLWILFIIYMFALVFRQLTDGTTLGDLRFRSIPESVWYLVLTGIVPDVADHANEIWDEGGAFQALLYLIFCVLVSITVMNMLVGILVGVVQSYAHMEKEEMVIERVKTTVLDTLNKVDGPDVTADAMMSKVEFDMLMGDQDAIGSFDFMGVDVVGLLDFGNQIFANGRELPIQAFMELLMELRGNNHATVKDIVDLRRFVDMHVQAIEELLHMTHHGKFKSSEANLARERARAGPLDHLVSNLPTAVLPRQHPDDLSSMISRGI